ncbi:MAG TPA: methionine--tRNA ligase subunit beta [Chitinophagaceae bacterium]|nr:methionine--tRNA ligase subunit beta [Chitinophagaceae bacterium]
MTNPKRYLVTSALPYANGLKHVGHLAGAYIPADIYVRYLRAQKRDVVFVCGSDEHGTAIPIQAAKEGTTPRAIIDKYHEAMKQDFKDLSMSFDIYHRTSEPIHHETAQEFFTYLNDRGDLETKESEQYYDEEAKTFLADRYIKGICPNCGSDRAYGDQCENCGRTLSPDELINPVSTLSGKPPIKKKTTHWYLPLGKHEEFLREWILKQHKDDWRATVVGQCRSWIDGGLQSRAVTRDLDWGVKVPVPAPLPPEGVDEELYNSKSAYGYRTADPMTYSLLKTFVEQHRSKPTEAENALWQILRGKKIGGYKFRRQHIINNYIADFIALAEKLVIEIDGLIHQLPENQISDEERTIELNRFGFEVIRFTNDQVLNDTDNVVNAILLKLEERKSKLSDSPIPPSGGGGAKVLYVWFDAPIGYISATKQWAIDNKKEWEPYWYDKETKLVHFVGKDNIVFHCIIFPVMLKLHGNILPDNVPANEFLNLEGDKMSTSRNWKVDMRDYINDFVKKENGGGQCVDMLRYYLTQIAPETKDSEFTWKGFQDAVNNELVSIFGNFVNRTWVLMHKLCHGKVPKLHEDVMDDNDRTLIEDIKNAKARIEGLLEGFKFREALFEVIDLSRKGNQYMQKKEPWKAPQAPPPPEGGILGESSLSGAQKNVDNCIHLCLQLTANLAILVNPFLPNTATSMLHLMKVVDKILDWENAGKLKLLSVGYSLREPKLLFRKIDDGEITAQVEKLKAGLKKSMTGTENNTQDTKGAEPSAPGVKPVIQYDDFARLDFKTGTIIAAEKVAKADKLLKLEVDLGFEKRTIVSGIALHFNPDAIIGKQVVVVANLAPRKMKGIESNGMILMAEDKDGKLKFINPDEKVTNGSPVN